MQAKAQQTGKGETTHTGVLRRIVGPAVHTHAKCLIVEGRSWWGGGFMGGCNEGAQDPPTDMLVYYLWVAQNLNRCCIGGREVGVHK